MAKRKKSGGGGASSEEAYLVAFGSTMTILLALFIVLSTLAQTQEGGFKSGTGSFVRALNTFGFPGLFGGTESLGNETAIGPQYHIEGEEKEEKRDEGGQVNDFEQERLTRLLRDMRRRFESESTGESTIRVAVLWLEGPLQIDASGRPVLSRKQTEQLLPYLPALSDPRIRQVYVELLRSSGSPEALARDLAVAGHLRDIIAAMASTNPERLVPLVRSWRRGGNELRARLVFVR